MRCRVLATAKFAAVQSCALIDRFEALSLLFTACPQGADCSDKSRVLSQEGFYLFYQNFDSSTGIVATHACALRCDFRYELNRLC